MHTFPFSHIWLNILYLVHKENEKFSSLKKKKNFAKLYAEGGRNQFYFNLLSKFNNYFRAKNKYPIDHNQYKFITDILIFVVLKFLFPDEINNSFALIRRSGE
jgi:hypothetical protein